MLAIHTPTSVGWPTSTTGASASMPPVGGVDRVRKVSADSRSGGEHAAAAQEQRPTAQAPGPQAMDDAKLAAPLLPRPQTPEEERKAREAEAAAEGQGGAGAADQVVPPQELLATVWQASAEVVEQTLGEETGVMNAEELNGPAWPDREVVAYDENGQGMPAPLELGTIVSEKA